MAHKEVGTVANRYDPTKNSEGYRDPTPYEALQKQARNQIRGKQSRIAGEHFENRSQRPVPSMRNDGSPRSRKRRNP